MESTVNVEFNLNQNVTIIQANLDDPFQSIIVQYIQKASIKPYSVFFLANSNLIEPKQTVENHMNDIDKMNDKLTVFANLIHSKDIICPECKEPCLFTLDNYKIKLFGCAYNHARSNIKLSDFYETQKKEMPEHKNNYIYQKHNIIFENYCLDCHSNLCSLCGADHSHHKTIAFSDLKPNIEYTKNKLKEFRTVLDALNEQIQDIIYQMNKLLEDLNVYYEINNNILKNYEENNINYQILKNINEININNQIYEKIKNINSNNNIKDKIQDILGLYININENEIFEKPQYIEKNEIFEISQKIEINETIGKENEITPVYVEEKLNKIKLIYKVEKGIEYLKLFGNKFVENNKNNCYMMINGERIGLSEYIQLNVNEYKTLEVDLL